MAGGRGKEDFGWQEIDMIRFILDSPQLWISGGWILGDGKKTKQNHQLGGKGLLEKQRSHEMGKC